LKVSPRQCPGAENPSFDDSSWRTIDRAEERRVELMKANGFNAIRTSHNPPSKQFLDACDRFGLLVIDEAFDMWEHPKNPQDYSNYFRANWKSDQRA
jgi:beta-galactosidase